MQAEKKQQKSFLEEFWTPDQVDPYQLASWIRIRIPILLFYIIFKDISEKFSI